MHSTLTSLLAGLLLVAALAAAGYAQRPNAGDTRYAERHGVVVSAGPDLWIDDLAVLDRSWKFFLTDL